MSDKEHAPCAECARLREFVKDVIFQWGYRHTDKGRDVLTTGGLSILEDAFDILGLPDLCTHDQVMAALAPPAPPPPCATCYGDHTIRCERCKGAGVVNPWDEPSQQITCPDCKGEGEVPCPDCTGREGGGE